jgi:hypothetical protein
MSASSDPPSSLGLDRGDRAAPLYSDDIKGPETLGIPPKL